MVKLLNKIEILAEQINKYIKDTKEYRDFCYYDELIKNNDFLKKEEIVIKAMQKKIVNDTAKGTITEEYKLDYQNRLAKFNENPLIVNYQNTIMDLNSLLQYINDYINGTLK